MIFLRAALLALPFLLCSGALALGQNLGGDAPVDLSADDLSFDRPTNTYHADGEVFLRKGDLTLEADRVQFNTLTEEATAEGKVRLVDPQGVVEAESLSIELESGRGRLADGRILIRDRNYRIAGDLIERLGETDYRVEDGTFTTCDGPVPDWKFGARRLDVTLGGYARARHVVFYLRDIPVLYIPYFAYPVKTERESGFLTPRVGSSNRRGVQLSLAWYQVIARNQDVTLYLDYLSELGLGKGLEYRYIFGEDSRGEMHLYHISGFNEAEDRQALDWEHLGELPGEIQLTADLEYVSSRDYFDDFGEAAEEYNRDKAQSILALSRSWAGASLAGQFKYTKDLDADREDTLQKLPEVVFTLVRRPIRRSPFFFAFEASTTHFWREAGLKGQRLTARPELSAVFQPGDLLEVRPQVGYRERLYWTSGDGPGYEREGIPDFSLTLASRLRRVFPVAGERVRKVQHSVVPELIFSYIPEEDQGNLPSFDALDRIGPENTLTLSLINRLTARIESEGGLPEYLDFLYLRLSQKYDIDESRRALLAPQDERTPFSPLEARLIVRPTPAVFLDLETAFDFHSEEEQVLDRFTLLNVSAGARDSAGNGLALEYRYRREEQEYLDAAVDLAWLRPVYLHYRHRYDLQDRASLEQIVGMEYRAQCWSFFLTVRDRLDDTEYLFSFALTGLGQVAELGGRLGRGDN